MKILFASILAFLAALAPASAQTTLTQTALTAAMTATQNYAPVAAATNIAVGRVLYIDNELMTIRTTYTTGLNIPVVRNGAKKSGHISGSMVLTGKPNQFSTFDPFGEPYASSNPPAPLCPNILSTPYVVVNSGNQWLCGLLLKWVPGFGNSAAPAQLTTAVASAAGLITPSGPLFHITGALAITGFNIPVGFANGSFTVIPDGAFTTTTANNIAIASTAVVGRAIRFTYDANTSKFYPSY